MTTGYWRRLVTCASLAPGSGASAKEQRKTKAPNALLLRQGHEPAGIRGMQHNLAARAELAIACGLHLRKRTKAHLSARIGNREYLVTRYSPDMTVTVLSQPSDRNPRGGRQQSVGNDEHRVGRRLKTRLAVIHAKECAEIPADSPVAGLGPATHVFERGYTDGREGVDGRAKPGQGDPGLYRARYNNRLRPTGQPWDAPGQGSSVQEQIISS